MSWNIEKVLFSGTVLVAFHFLSICFVFGSLQFDVQ
jgi:hypothetical protein